MPKLLMLAYYFPPLGGAGVQRSAKFAKYLAALGWEIQVVSVDPPDYEPIDRSLEAEITTERITVTRVPVREAFRAFDRLPGGWRLRSTLQEGFLFPDRMAGWYGPALKAASRICAGNPGIPVYTTSAPYTAHRIGLALKERFRAPWIADFRDEWSRNPYLKHPTVLHRRRHQAAEREVLTGADLVISVTEQITEDLRILGSGGRADFITIPNGYDPDDFKALPPSPRKRWALTHVGTLNSARAALIQPLLEVTAALIESGRIPASDVLVRLIGTGSDRVLGLNPANLEVHNYWAHPQAVAAMADSSLLVLAEGNPAAFTGKIFEYLGVGRPVLGLVHPGSPAAQLIREAEAGWVMDPEDRIGLEGIIEQSYRCWKANEPPVKPRPDVLGRYNRKLQAEFLAEQILRYCQ